ncbi:MAG: hypothetical protein QM499_03415 [Flavobacteriaceae bacterium]
MKNNKENNNDLLNKIQNDNKVKKSALKKIINALDKNNPKKITKKNRKNENS